MKKPTINGLKRMVKKIFPGLRRKKPDPKKLTEKERASKIKELEQELELIKNKQNTLNKVKEKSWKEFSGKTNKKIKEEVIKLKERSPKWKGKYLTGGYFSEIEYPEIISIIRMENFQKTLKKEEEAIRKEIFKLRLAHQTLQKKKIRQSP